MMKKTYIYPEASVCHIISEKIMIGATDMSDPTFHTPSRSNQMNIDDDEENDEELTPPVLWDY